ncbi:MAG: hypothetical protein GY856_32945 [bacterium]|nr:hypothetical protein [bacterium]
MLTSYWYSLAYFWKGVNLFGHFDEVTTLVGPSELIDVVATERGIAINPRRQDLIDALRGSDLPIRPIEEIAR